jgi:hypothetical protein
MAKAPATPTRIAVAKRRRAARVAANPLAVVQAILAAPTNSRATNGHGNGHNAPRPYRTDAPVLDIDMSHPDSATKQVFVRVPGGVVNVERDRLDKLGRKMTRVAVEAAGESPEGTWLFGGRALGPLLRVLQIIQPLYGVVKS